jgi:hypothetical protein
MLFSRMLLTLFSTVLRFVIAFLHKWKRADYFSRPPSFENLGYFFFLFRILSHAAAPVTNATSTIPRMVFNLTS